MGLIEVFNKLLIAFGVEKKAWQSNLVVGLLLGNLLFPILDPTLK